MNERDIKHFILRALLRAKGPMLVSTIIDAVRAGFMNSEVTTGDLLQYLRDLEETKLVAGTDDDVFGPMWDLTPKGKIKAQQLR